MFTARYALSPFITQIRFVLNGLIIELRVCKEVNCFTDTKVQCENIHNWVHKHLALYLTASQINPVYALRLSSIPQILMLISHPIESTIF